jgi:hypothetical protein
MQKELNELAQSLSLGQIDKDEYDREKAAIVESYERQQQEQDRAERNEVERILSVANQAVPLAWPAYGARRAAEGALLPALLASVGLALIAGASLWRAYGVTVRLYTGQFNAGKVPAEATPVAKSAAEPEKSPAARSSSTLIEKRLPWISEQASAIAVSCFRSLTRAPEVKMLLMSPLILVVVFGGLFVKAGSAPSEFARPLVAAGAICMILLGVSQLAGNQFGFDRSGFRVFVLASASRKDILLGKNLSLAPLVVGLCFFVTLVLQFIFPMRLDHFVATLAQAISMYFVYCFVANWLSMFAPMPVASGALRPTQTKGMALLMGFAFIFVFPPAMAITLIPLGIELWLDWTGWSSAFPIYLVCALVECAGVVFLYGKALRWQGNILQSREQKILEIVTSKAE